MSDNPSSGSVNNHNDGVVNIKSPSGPTTDTYHQTQPRIPDDGNIETAHVTPSESNMSIRKPSKSPLASKDEYVTQSQSPDDLVPKDKADSGPTPKPLDVKPNKRSPPIISFLKSLLAIEPEAQRNIREFEQIYSEEEQTPTRIARILVDYVECINHDAFGLIAAMDMELGYYKQANKNLKDLISSYSEKLEEIDKQLLANPNIPFSFASLIKRKAGGPDGGDGQTRLGENSSGEGRDDQSTLREKVNPSTGYKRGHKRAVSKTPVTDLLPLANQLEDSISKLRVTTQLGLARDFYLAKKTTEALSAANKAIELCELKSLSRERILLARAIFWKAQAETQLMKWREARLDFEDVSSLGLGPTSNCPEGDVVEELMMIARSNDPWIKKRTASFATRPIEGGTPTYEEIQAMRTAR